MMSILLWLALACTGSTFECSENTPCELGSVCVEGTCVTQNCATSDQCGIGQYCGPQNTCVEGCQGDTDCIYGEYCAEETSTCEVAECSDTRIDCDFGEFCSPAGECYQAAGYYCRDCENDEDCGGNGNYCLSGYCGVACVADSDCPSGYDCLPLSDVNGNIISYQCWTYCWLYEEEG